MGELQVDAGDRSKHMNVQVRDADVPADTELRELREPVSALQSANHQTLCFSVSHPNLPGLCSTSVLLSRRKLKFGFCPQCSTYGTEGFNLNSTGRGGRRYHLPRPLCPR